jgi:hypothetical protein
MRTVTQWKLIGSSMTAPPPIVVAQRYSCTTFGTRFKNFISILYILKIE